MKSCNLVIGQEGGLTNLAAGVGTKTLITTDFMNYLYGPHGRMKRFNEVKLGPNNLCPNKVHVHANPYISDKDLVDLIYATI